MFTHGTLTIERYALGPFQTNCYIARGPGHAPAVFDCGIDPGPLLDRLDELKASEGEPAAFALTHAHIDHIAGLREARHRFPGSPIWIHSAEREWLLDPEQNLSASAGMPVTAPAADRLLEHGETLELAGHAWEVRHTPGHSPGGVAFVCADVGVAIVGDALFSGSIGRTDFPGSSFERLERSIREQLYTFDPGVAIYPGHGPESTIGQEMRGNEFVRG